MTALILLNGPPGIGKSTLAARFADAHPGTLNLDIDRLHPLVGGWQDPSGRTHDILRPVALAMASVHLSGGRDVVLPQYLSSPTEVDAFAALARDHGADFHEIVLLDARPEALARFDRRPDATPWDVHNRQVVEHHGGPAFLAALYDQLAELVRLRPSAVVVRSPDGDVDTTYAVLLAALGRPDAPPG